ncbi:threonine-phosphate decarboxylase [Sandarakinorhabdus sp.]|uniref:threonine-phosphate decarboxylase n=1 Tax=Sandarakinorhabdus sp. TaxID=1916663 RepID=UPI003342BB75
MAAARAIAAFTVHGGRIGLARAAFAVDADWIDLSTGISPWAYPARIDPADLHQLPDPAGLVALETAAAAVFGSDPAQTIAVPGSDIGLRLVGALAGAQRPAVLGPGYSGHLAMWSAPQMVDALVTAGHDALVLARPGNPDGMIVDRQQLGVAARELAAKDGWLIVDEAYADAGGEPSIAAERWPATIVLRSLGKFFGLAGVRLGFVIAPPPLAGRLRRMLGDWPVSGPAITIGTAAYADTPWQAGQRTRMTGMAAEVTALLAAAGLTPVGGTSCFTLVETGDAAALFTHLAEHAILTRPFADNPHRLRIGLPPDAQGLARLASALQTAPQSRPPT